MSDFDVVRHEVDLLSSPERAESSAWFFKTGPGQYGEGDSFAGLSVPQSRAIAKKHISLSLENCEKLLASPIHEHRLIALIILVGQFKKGDEEIRKKIFDFYLAHTDRINNWDLVDTSADTIVGEWVADHDLLAILRNLARSSSLWEKRIAILSTFAYLRRGSADATFVIADMLLHEEEDLLHKAVGWLLREAGKRVGRKELVEYLQSRYRTMPRTMLRYSIEHFSESDRKKYLQGLA